MAIFDKVINSYSNYVGGYSGNPPTDEEEYNTLVETYPTMWSGVPPSWSEIEASMLIKSTQEKRKAEYPSTDDLIVALWENVVEERAASVISLEATRQAIKAKYPK